MKFSSALPTMTSGLKFMPSVCVKDVGFRTVGGEETSGFTGEAGSTTSFAGCRLLRSIGSEFFYQFLIGSGNTKVNI